MDNVRLSERVRREQAEPDSAPQASGAWDAARFWAELSEYRKRREDWERELQRLMQAERDLEARHWQLVLHAIEATAGLEAHEAHDTLQPAVAAGEGPAFEERMRLFERSLLDTALAQTNGCRRRAAALLGILPTTLCEKLKRLGMAERPH